MSDYFIFLIIFLFDFNTMICNYYFAYNAYVILAYVYK